MPCLILTGHPSAGKTTLAKLIAERAKSQFSIDSVTIINEASACPDKSIGECYATSQAEKATRGALKSAVDRAMAEATSSSTASSNNSQQQQVQHLVILDSLNYIKGFRYELHCISKAAQQQHGVVWVLNSLQQAKAWNQARQHKQSDKDNQDFYSDELWEALVQRYEPPDERNRWDKPLYIINVQPNIEEGSSQQETEALAKSVYNMHDLSAVLSSTTPMTTPSTESNSQNKHDNQIAPPAAADSTISPEAPKKKTPKARFKRAKKPATTSANDPSTSAVQSTSLVNETTNSSPDTAPITTNTASSPTNQEDATASKKRKSVEEQVDDMLKDFLQSSKLQQGMSTQQFVAHENADLLHLMDGVSQYICRAIQKHSLSPDETSSSTTTVSVTLPRQSEATALQVDTRLCSPANKGQLSAWKRQYMKWTALHPPPASSSIPQMAQAFCDYLQAQIPK